jgi:adenosylcobinamide kinase/adenosylcobinamide-phosphate guanylyltransferase
MSISSDSDKSRGIIFVTGGARSGKSSFALDLADRIHGRKAYIATAEPLDDEMEERIRRHRQERGEEWTTFEEPLDIAGTISEIRERYQVILLDCITLWLSNLMREGLTSDKAGGTGQMFHVEQSTERLLSSLKDFRTGSGLSHSSALIIVSNEVGMGIVPGNLAARLFRDIAGALNQKIAELADEVYLVVSGIPMKLKGQ